MEKIVNSKNNKAVTNTQIIARYFGRNHNEVIHALRYLMNDCGATFSKDNFFTQEQDDNLYWVTCAGFMVLSGLFLGTRNARTKITFIDAFNKVQREINRDMSIINDNFAVINAVKSPAVLAGQAGF